MALLAKIQETDFEKRLRQQTEPVAEPAPHGAAACQNSPQPSLPLTREQIASTAQPCPVCSSHRFWVDRCSRATHCLTCEPCPSPGLAEFYFRLHVPGLPGSIIPGVAGELEPLSGGAGSGNPIEQPELEQLPYDTSDSQPDDWEGTEIDQSTITPCPRCKSQHAWWNLLGVQKCMICEPPRASRRVLRLARAFREKYRPDPRYAKVKSGEVNGEAKASNQPALAESVAEDAGRLF